MDLLTKANGDLQDDLETFQVKYNVTQVSPDFYVGGAIVNRDETKLLETFGVDLVLCVAAKLCDDDQDLLRKRDLKLYCAYLDEPTDPQTFFDYRDIVACWAWYQAQVARRIQRGRCYPKVFVHCSAGVHRGPAVMAVFLSVIGGCSYDDALSLVASRRPEIRPWQFPLLIAACRRAVEMIKTGQC